MGFSYEIEREYVLENVEEENNNQKLTGWQFKITQNAEFDFDFPHTPFLDVLDTIDN